MLRVLFVCPHFAPTNAPDGHRVRLLLPHLSAAGIEAEVLSVEPSASHFPTDPWLCESIPDSIPVHQAKARSKRWGRIPGLGSLSFRAISGLRELGDQLLSENRFDLIYFSTTQFGTHLLGPHWKEKFGIPFFMDFQDPWVNDYYREHPDQTPPGGKMKFATADRFNRKAEPHVLAHCSGITSVSPAYPESLSKRYGDSPFVSNSLFSNALVAPFPAEKAELERIKRSDIRQSIFDPEDGFQHWIYTGRCGPFMEKSIRALFQAIHLASQQHPESASQLRLHFIGTSYSRSENDSPILAAAREYGIESIVDEVPNRIPLSESLQCLLDADSLIVPGSDDPGYNASKIYPYLLAEKPLLAVFHKRSPITELIQKIGGGVSISFEESDSTGDIAQRIVDEVFASGLSIPLRPLNQTGFFPHTAAAQAVQLEAFFRSILHSELKELDKAA